MNHWTMYCMEGDWPGLWRRWHREQVVTVGWNGTDGFRLEGKTRRDPEWEKVRGNLASLARGDMIVVRLPGARMARIGEVVRLRIEDRYWDPLVKPYPGEPKGEMGRRALVRWLSEGPIDPDWVVDLPKPLRRWRGTLTFTEPERFEAYLEALKDENNWEPISSWKFKYEKALSDYIASFPHRLEDGLMEYPYVEVREKVFRDSTRSDVLLVDPQETPVVVECKQYGPTVADVAQVRRYVKHVQRLTGKKTVRGILVHGGSRKLSSEVHKALSAE